MVKEEYISKKEIERRTKKPAFGYATKKGIVVRKDLNPKIKKFVRQHELEHTKRLKKGQSK